MRILSGTSTFGKEATLLYRAIRYRRGFGVHSPFVFDLITKVIEEECPYYRFNEIELLRKQLLGKEEQITYPDRRSKGKLKSRTIGAVVKREAIRPKQGALLFRLANYFKSKNILQVGTTTGISTLYLTSYASGLRCVALENIPAFSTIIQQAFAKLARNPIDLRIGDYTDIFPKALEEMGNIDFLFFNTPYESDSNRQWIRESLRYVHDHSVLVIEGINSNVCMRTFWEEIKASPKVSVTLDLFSLGIVLFDKRLHKKNYIANF